MQERAGPTWVGRWTGRTPDPGVRRGLAAADQVLTESACSHRDPSRRWRGCWFPQRLRGIGGGLACRNPDVRDVRPAGQR